MTIRSRRESRPGCLRLAGHRESGHRCAGDAVVRRAGRRDSAEPELIALAKGIGALCWQLQEPVDWLIGWRGQWIPCEVKTGKGTFTEQQVRFSIAAKERGLIVWVWRTPEDVLSSLGARRTA
jgi:hypothetical protein